MTQYSQTLREVIRNERTVIPEFRRARAEVLGPRCILNFSPDNGPTGRRLQQYSWPKRDRGGPNQYFERNSNPVPALVDDPEEEYQNRRVSAFGKSHRHNWYRFASPLSARFFYGTKWLDEETSILFRGGSDKPGSKIYKGYPLTEDDRAIVRYIDADYGDNGASVIDVARMIVDDATGATGEVYLQSGDTYYSYNWTRFNEDTTPGMFYGVKINFMCKRIVTLYDVDLLQGGPIRTKYEVLRPSDGPAANDPKVYFWPWGFYFSNNADGRVVASERQFPAGVNSSEPISSGSEPLNSEDFDRIKTENILSLFEYVCGNASLDPEEGIAVRALHFTPESAPYSNNVPRYDIVPGGLSRENLLSYITGDEGLIDISLRGKSFHYSIGKAVWGEWQGTDPDAPNYVGYGEPFPIEKWEHVDDGFFGLDIEEFDMYG